MKIWLVEIFVWHPDSEYGFAASWYRESKPFATKDAAKKYLKKFRKDFEKDPIKYEVYGFANDESEIKEIEVG